MVETPSHREAMPFDVVIVGAGPAGSTAAYYLAKAGIDVTVLEKTSFPREKVCGDGLTPRAVGALQELEIPYGDEAHRIDGLRMIAGRQRRQLPWPEHGRFPSHGAVWPRNDSANRGDLNQLAHRLRADLKASGLAMQVIDRYAKGGATKFVLPDGVAIDVRT